MLEALTINRLFKLGEKEVDDTRDVLVDESVAEGPVKLTERRLVNLSRSVAGQMDVLLQKRLGRGLKDASLAVCMSNGAEYVPTFLGIGGSGGINCLLNPKYLEPEISFAVEDLSCVAIVVSGANCPEECAKTSEKLKVPVMRVFWKKTVDGVFDLEVVWNDSGETAGEEANAFKFGVVSGSSIALKLHTSGTTSKPKTVPISHANIVVTCLNQANTFGWQKDSHRSVLVMPLFHVHGLFNGCLGPLSQGCFVAIPASKAFSKSSIWTDLERLRANAITAVPSILQIMFLDVNKAVENVKFKYIRGCSSALPPAVAEKICKYANTEVLESYAMTEATHQMCSNVPSKSQPGSVGWPTGTEIAIVATDGRICKSDEPGEICVRGYNVIEGYAGLTDAVNASHFYRTETLTAGESFASSTPDVRKVLKGDEEPEVAFKKFVSSYKFDLVKNKLLRKLEDSPITERPFLRTGDLGSMSADGRVKYIGRLKELINRGGEKISPIEIDAAYLKLAGVKTAAAFGVEDTILGEKVAIAIVPSADAESSDHAELAKTLAQNAGLHLAPFKVPAVAFFCEELPMGPTGKVLRREIPGFVKSRTLQAYECRCVENRRQ